MSRTSAPSIAWLAPHVHAAPVGGDLVFLDVDRDAYYCWPEAERQVQVSAHNAVVHAVDAETAANLTAAGLVTRQANTAVRRAAPRRPKASAVPLACDPPSWRDVPQAARCLLDLFIHYRGRPFSEIIGQTQDPAAFVDQAPTPELLALAARFHRWIPYAPVSAKCLLRSFMLLRLLRRHSHDARWVFGVATWPFRAHCWLQCGEVVLNDEVDRVVTYQPILAL